MPDPDLSSVESVLWAVNVVLTTAVGVLFWRLVAASNKINDAYKDQSDGAGAMATLLESTKASNAEVRTALTEVARRLEKVEARCGQ